MKIARLAILISILLLFVSCGYRVNLRSDTVPDMPEVSGEQIKIYVTPYIFEDGVGNKLQIGWSRAEGDIANWIKRAIRTEIPGAVYTTEQQGSDLVIVPTAVEFNRAAGIKARIAATVNGKEIVARVYGKSPGLYFRPFGEDDYNNSLTLAARLMASEVKKGIKRDGQKVTLSDIPRTVSASFTRATRVVDFSEIFDYEVER